MFGEEVANNPAIKSVIDIISFNINWLEIGIVLSPWDVAWKGAFNAFGQEFELTNPDDMLEKMFPDGEEGGVTLVFTIILEYFCSVPSLLSYLF